MYQLFLFIHFLALYQLFIIHSSIYTTLYILGDEMEDLHQSITTLWNELYDQFKTYNSTAETLLQPFHIQYQPCISLMPSLDS